MSDDLGLSFVLGSMAGLGGCQEAGVTWWDEGGEGEGELVDGESGRNGEC